MLSNEQIILFGFPKWEGDYMKSTVHLAKELAKNNQVLYVDYPYTWIDLIRGLKGKPFIPVKEIMGWNKRLKPLESETNKNLHLLRLPPILPMNWVNQQSRFEQLARFNTRMIVPTVQKTTRQLGFSDPIVINAFLPALGIPLKDAFNEKLLVYYCYDEIQSAPWIKKHGARQEAKFMELADLVITSSVQLHKNKGPLAKDIGIVKNGVDLKLFGKENLVPIAPLSSNKYKYNIGYIGSIDSRLDVPLLTHAIQEHPNLFFSFVGRIVDQEIYSCLSQFENVKFYGPQDIEQLPSFIEQFDIGIIPFLKNKLTASIYPLKVNEYLARAKPVVSTNFANLQDFTKVIKIAKNQAAFTNALSSMAADNDLNIKEMRLNIAAENAWENRGLQFGELIKRKLLTKKRNAATEKRIKPFQSTGSSIFEERNRTNELKAIT